MLFDTDFIGIHQLGEVPTTPLQYQFKDSDNVAIDISAFSTATFLYWDPARIDAAASASIVSAATGIVSVEWTSAMTNTVGLWRCIFWLDGAVPGKKLKWTVVDGPGPTA